MKHRIIVFILVTLLGIIFLSADYFKNPNIFGVCVGINGFCKSDWLDGVWFPVYKSLIYIISSLTILIFFPFHYLKTWMKIMIPYSVVAFIIVSLTSPLCSGMICFDRTLVASGLSKIFLILTVLILLTKSIYSLFVSRKLKS